MVNLVEFQIHWEMADIYRSVSVSFVFSFQQRTHTHIVGYLQWNAQFVLFNVRTLLLFHVYMCAPLLHKLLLINIWIPKMTIQRRFLRFLCNRKLMNQFKCTCMYIWALGKWTKLFSYGIKWNYNKSYGNKITDGKEWKRRGQSSILLPLQIVQHWVWLLVLLILSMTRCVGWMWTFCPILTGNWIFLCARMS